MEPLDVVVYPDPVLRRGGKQVTMFDQALRDLAARMFEVISKHGSHPEWGREVPSLVAALGLRDIRAESEYPYFHGGSELAEFWKRSCSRVRDGLAAAGADVSEWDPGLAQFDDPTRLFVAPMTVSVIAIK